MRIAALAPLAILVACGPTDGDPGPGGVTVGEAKALDEAAEMLDQRRQSSKREDRPAASPSSTTSGEAQ